MLQGGNPAFDGKAVYAFIDLDRAKAGKNKGSIFTDKRIVDKAVKKLIGHKKKHTLVPLNLTLISQHGYGVDDN